MNTTVDGLMHEVRPRGDGLDRERIAAAVSGVLFGRESAVSIGRFVVESRLGVGGMGIVYRGYDPKLDRRVAIKVLDLRRVSAHPAVTQARLILEARALAQLAHPNVVSVHDVGALDEGSEDSRLYLVMEYVEGPTLRQWMSEEHPLEARVEMLLGAGRGLAAAHAAGLLHGDFKPDNILVGADGRARVADFGLALPILELDGRTSETMSEVSPRLRGDPTGDRAGDRTSTSEVFGASGITLSGVFGTPAYIAPEQFLRARVDARADQFSFCVVACELLVGRRPFAGDSLETLGAAALAGELVELDDGGLPRAVLAVLKRGLAADPSQRFADMPELLARLQAGFDRRRGRARWLLAATGAAVMAGSLGLWLIPDPQPETQAGAPEIACRSAEARLEPIWTRERAETISARLEAALPRGSQAATTLLGHIDDHVRAWGEAWTRSCTLVVDQATRERTEACLDARLLELRGVVEALVDPTTALDAPLAVLDELTPVARCLDPASLDAARPVPLEAGLRAEVEAVRNELIGPAELAILRSHTEAITLGREGLERAIATGFRPLQAEAELVLGRALWNSGSIDEATAMIERAHLSAEASRHAPVLAEAAGSRVAIAAQVADLETGRTWLARAVAANEAAGDDPGLSVRLHVTACMFALLDGEYERAVEACEQGQALVDQGARVDAHTRAVLITNLAITEGSAGRLDSAERHFEAAQAAAELDVGNREWVLFKVLLHSGHIAYYRGDLELALSRYEGALERLAPLGDEGRPELAVVHASRAGALRELGRLDEAEVAYAEALALGREFDDYWTTHQVRSELAWILLERGQTRAAYEAWIEQLPSAREQLGPDHPWLLALENNIGEAQALLGEVDEGLARMDAAIATIERSFGPDHPENATFLAVRAYVAGEVGRFAICVADYDRVLAIELRRAGPGTPAVAAVEVDRAECRLALDEDPAALLPEVEAAVAVLARGPRRRTEASGRVVLGDAYLRIGDARAVAELERAHALLSAAQGDESKALAKVERLLRSARRLPAPSK